MSNSANQNRYIPFAEQISGHIPAEAVGLRLVATAGRLVFPDPKDPPLPLTRLTRPSVPEGEYFVDWIGRNNEVLEVEGEPLVVSLFRKQRPIQNLPAPAPSPPPPATMQDLYDGNPERWAQVAAIRDDAQIRDVSVSLLHQGMKQILELHEVAQGLHKDTLSIQKKAVEYVQQMTDEEFAKKKKLLSELDEIAAQRVALAKGAGTDEKKGNDNTAQIIIAAIGTLQALGLGVIAAVSGRPSPDTDRAKLAAAALLKAGGDPASFQKLTNEQQAAQAFARAIKIVNEAASPKAEEGKTDKAE